MKLPGWIILGLGICFGIITLFFQHYIYLYIKMPALYYKMLMDNSAQWFSMQSTDITDELAGLFIILGSLFVTLSKEKSEDEFIMKLRLDSLLWALIVNSILMVLALCFIYGTPIYMVFTINIVSIQLLFIIKFKIALKRGY